MPLDVPPPRKTWFGSPVELSRVHWLKPELVCEVTYLTLTADGLLRAVSYQGVRADKSAKDVRWPRPSNPQPNHQQLFRRLRLDHIAKRLPSLTIKPCHPQLLERLIVG
jgi:ATP-dependent DNA ligase